MVSRANRKIPAVHPRARTLLKAAVDLQIVDPYPEIAIGYTGNIMTGIVFDTLSAAEALESASSGGFASRKSSGRASRPARR